MEVAGKTSTSQETRGFLPAFFRRWAPLAMLADILSLGLVAALLHNVQLPLLVVFLIAVPMIFFAAGLYSERLHIITLDQSLVAIGAVTLAASSLVTINFMLLGLPLQPAEMLRLWLTAAIALPAGRLLVAPIHSRALRKGQKRRTLIVGSGMSAALVADKIQHHPELGLQVAGFIDDGPRRSVRGRHEPLLGNIRALVPVINTTEAEVVILAFVKNHYQEILKALYQLEPRVEVLIMPRYYEFLSASLAVEDLSGMPLLGMNRKNPSLFSSAFKRAEDLVVGGLMLTVALPLFPIIALAIKLDSPGPVFYRGPRIGKDLREFTAYKFRSMGVGAETDTASHDKPRDAAKRGLKTETNPAVTRVGQFLRKSSLDELPQLINVLRGDMSLVGPRPPLPSEVSDYYEWQKKRLSVRPGLTGIWQVSGRSELPFDERVWLDFMYIDSWSPWLDFRILLQTVGAVISMRGAC